MLDNLRDRLTSVLAHIELQVSPDQEMLLAPRQTKTVETHDDPAFQYGGGDNQAQSTPVRRRQAAAQVNPDDPTTWGRVSRNAPCPCGTGKKFKHCHGKVA